MASGKAQTVLGLIEPSKLGRTLTHEHLVMDYKNCFFKPVRESDMETVNLNEITLRNLNWIYQNPYSHKYNLSLGDEPLDEIISEAAEFKKEGGSTIVENTTNGIQRNVELLKKISLATGLNVISGTGFYLDHTVTEEMKALTVEEMSNMMTKDLTVGVDSTGIKCGVIGEVGCSWPLAPFEKKSLQASAMAQTDTGAPVIIHPGRNDFSPKECLRVFQEAGGDVKKTVMSHLDRTIFDRKILVDLAETGCYLEYDLFGMEMIHYQANPAVDMPSDSQRVQEIKFLIDEGYEDQIMMAHDVHTRHRLLKYGGHGYSHIQVNIIPKMLKRGISQEVVDKIQIDNPRTWLTFK
ncbi:phosphotriesterase-related protein-like isoform X2 [Exaiptasia diaphana]|nr:phosphotriesterase-related protein-like isoform X2 [Exaiptasia diaphana]